MATTTAPIRWSPATGGRAIRGGPRQLWQVPAFFAGVLVLLGVWLARPLWHQPDPGFVQRELTTARGLLQQPDCPVAQVKLHVERALGSPDVGALQAGEAHFLLGSAFLRQAGAVPLDQAGPAADGEPWQKARFHLEQAETLGVLEADRPALGYRLGKVWFAARVDPSRVVECLKRSVDQAADDPAEGYALLTRACLRLPQPDLQGALEANKKLLDLPTANEDVLAPARLQRGELLLRLGKPEEAREVLKFVKPPAPPALVAQARYLQARTFQEEEQWAKAAQAWREALDDPSAGPGRAGQVLYNLGLCYRRLDQADEAAQTWQQVLAQAQGDEGPAAALGLAELWLLDTNPQRALDAFARAVRDVHSAAEWQNAFCDLTHARELFERGCLIFHATGRYELALQLAGLYEKLAAAGVAQGLEAQAGEALGRAKLEQARQIRPPQAAQAAEEEARSLLRQAGRKHEAAAEGAPTPAEQAERLCRSADCYLQGQDYAAAVPLLERLVKQDLSAERMGQTWFLLAEARRATRQDDAALAAYVECLNHHGPYAYRARYQLAVTHIARKQWDNAADELLLNLKLLSADPDREAEEKTLYELGNLLFRRGNFLEASGRLEQALRNHPASAQAPRGRYQLAECYRQLAAQESQNLRQPERMTPGQEALLQKQYRSWLEKAVAQYDEVLKALAPRLQAGPLQEDEDLLFRQASFGVAECRSNLGDYASAVPIYEGLVARYHHRAESLYALSGIAQCHWRKGEPDQARATLGRMRAALKEMDDAAFPTTPGSPTRAQWEKWAAGQ